MDVLLLCLVFGVLVHLLSISLGDSLLKASRRKSSSRYVVRVYTERLESLLVLIPWCIRMRLFVISRLL